MGGSKINKKMEEDEEEEEGEKKKKSGINILVIQGKRLRAAEMELLWTTTRVEEEKHCTTHDTKMPIW